MTHLTDGWRVAARHARALLAAGPVRLPARSLRSDRPPAPPRHQRKPRHQCLALVVAVTGRRSPHVRWLLGPGSPTWAGWTTILASIRPRLSAGRGVRSLGLGGRRLLASIRPRLSAGRGVRSLGLDGRRLLASIQPRSSGRSDSGNVKSVAPDPRGRAGRGQRHARSWRIDRTACGVHRRRSREIRRPLRELARASGCPPSQEEAEGTGSRARAQLAGGASARCSGCAWFCW